MSQAGTAPDPASTPAAARCPRCGRGVAPDDRLCGLCGEVLARTEPPAGRVPPAAAARRAPAAPEPMPWLVLGAGLALAPVLTFTPLLRYVGWFTASLFHETGHAAVAWATGHGAVPAIRLDGHAAAVHGRQHAILCWMALAVLAAFAWRARRRPLHLAAWVAAAALYAVVAWTRVLREAVFLAAGQGGEVVFGGVLLALATTGGVTGGGAERAAHAMVGWYLAGRNAWLAGGLLWSPAARGRYAGSGSFGLENDLVRLSRDVLHVPLGTVAAVLFAAALAMPVAAVLVGRAIALRDT